MLFGWFWALCSNLSVSTTAVGAQELFYNWKTKHGLSSSRIWQSWDRTQSRRGVEVLPRVVSFVSSCLFSFGDTLKESTPGDRVLFHNKRKHNKIHGKILSWTDLFDLCLGGRYTEPWNGFSSCSTTPLPAQPAPETSIGSLLTLAMNGLRNSPDDFPSSPQLTQLGTDFGYGREKLQHLRRDGPGPYLKGQVCLTH